MCSCLRLHGVGAEGLQRGMSLRETLKPAVDEFIFQSFKHTIFPEPFGGLPRWHLGEESGVVDLGGDLDYDLKGTVSEFKMLRSAKARKDAQPRVSNPRMRVGNHLELKRGREHKYLRLHTVAWWLLS